MVMAPAQERFQSLVRMAAPDACWLWVGGKGSRGYGEFWLDGRRLGAHRFSWAQANGPIPDGLHVCHHCDNPPCVNPAHLFVGTATDNARDRSAKGRSLVGRARAQLVLGQRNGFAKLSDEDVRVIRSRRAAGEGCRAIAADFAITAAYVSDLARLTSRVG